MQLDNGKSYFYQWDVNRKVIVEDTVSEVHFSNEMMNDALVVNTKIENGQNVANVPDVLLQQDYDVMCYVMLDSCTKLEKTFEVKSRPKPTDYIYTEEEIKRLDDLYDKVEKLENGTGFNPQGTVLEQLLPIEKLRDYGDTVAYSGTRCYVMVTPKKELNGLNFMFNRDTTAVFLSVKDSSGNGKVTTFNNIFSTDLFSINYVNNVAYARVGCSCVVHRYDDDGLWVEHINTYIPAYKNDIVSEERVQELINASLPPSGEEVAY